MWILKGFWCWYIILRTLAELLLVTGRELGCNLQTFTLVKCFPYPYIRTSTCTWPPRPRRCARSTPKARARPRVTVANQWTAFSEVCQVFRVLRLRRNTHRLGVGFNSHTCPCWLRAYWKRADFSCRRHYYRFFLLWTRFWSFPGKRSSVYVAWLGESSISPKIEVLTRPIRTLVSISFSSKSGQTLSRRFLRSTGIQANVVAILYV